MKVFSLAITILLLLGCDNIDYINDISNCDNTNSSTAEKCHDNAKDNNGKG